MGTGENLHVHIWVAVGSVEAMQVPQHCEGYVKKSKFHNEIVNICPETEIQVSGHLR